MYTPEALLDLHERGHRSLSKLLAHCRQFSADEINRELAGFGYHTLRLQLHHMIGAEEYWIKVLQGRVEADDNDALFPTIESLEGYRQQVGAATDAYLKRATPAELNAARKMMTWGPEGNYERELVPAHVFTRTLTHIYQHQGQVVAMCRLLGKPAPGMDFPLT